jgi:hypothetical protein
LQNIDSARVFEFSMVDDEISNEQTLRLLSQADRLIVRVPDRNDEKMWARSRTLGFYYLTRDGLHQLDADIWAKKKAKWERRLIWMPVVGALTGLLGALSGVIAVWSKSKGGP